MSAPIRGERGLVHTVSRRAALVGLSIGLGFIMAAGAAQSFLEGVL